jgi:hypothetical protein
LIARPLVGIYTGKLVGTSLLRPEEATPASAEGWGSKRRPARTRGWPRLVSTWPEEAGPRVTAAGWWAASATRPEEERRRNNARRERWCYARLRMRRRG